MLRLAARRSLQQAQQYAALGSCRALATAPAQAPALDWEKLGEAIGSDAGKRELAQLRTTFLDVTQKVQDMQQEPVKIDWNAWKQEGVDASLVDAFKQAYESMPVPKYEDTGLAEVETEFTELEKQAEDMAKYSTARMAELQKELADVDAELERITKLTIDDVLEHEPELGHKLHAEISEGKFIPR